MKWRTMPLNAIKATVPYAFVGGPFGSNLTTRDYVQEGIPVIRGSNLPVDSLFREEDFVFVSEKKATDLRPNTAYPGDLIFTQRGTLGQVGLIPREAKYQRYIISQSQMKLTVNPKIAYAHFVYYLFRQPSMVQKVINCAITSGVPHINLGILKEFKIVLPEIDCQKRTADILSAYDNLIDTNRRRIQLLEESARLLFREWFVYFKFPNHEKVKIIKDGIGKTPEGWVKKKVVNVLKRVAPGELYDQATAKPTGGVPILDQGQSGIIGYHNNEPSVIASLDDPIIVFANHTCNQRIIHFPFSAIQNIFPFLPSDENYRNIYWLHYATDNLVQLNAYKGHWPEFMAKNILLPPEDLCEKFGNIISLIHKQIFNISTQNQKLAQTRDLLLPRLMSGAIEV